MEWLELPELPYFSSIDFADSLQNYKEAMQKRQSAQKDLDDQKHAQKNKEMTEKRKEYMEAQHQLKTLDTKLGKSPQQSVVIQIKK